MIISGLNKEKLDDKYRCAPGASILGSLCRSLGYDQEEFYTMTGIRLRDDVMKMRKRTPSYVLKRFRPLFVLLANTAQHYADENLPEGYPDWPGCSIAARAILIAAAKSSQDALQTYKDMKEARPDDWRDSPLRLLILSSFHQPEFLQHLELVDRATIEGAVCLILGLTRATMAKPNGLGENAQELIKGYQDWSDDEIEQIFLPLLEETSQWMREAIPAGEPDASHKQAIRNLTPVQIATIWQLWPRLRRTIQEESPWIYVHFDESTHDHK
jgi:hypothetical protein